VVEVPREPDVVVSTGTVLDDVDVAFVVHGKVVGVLQR
jgi:hypothetical protein